MARSSFIIFYGSTKTPLGKARAVSRDLALLSRSSRLRVAVSVTVLPISSQPPRSGTVAVAIPHEIKSRIGLNPARPAWVVVEDANVFTWPGFDLVPQPGGTFIRGVVTRGFFQQVKRTVLEVHARGRPRRIERDEN